MDKITKDEIDNELETVRYSLLDDEDSEVSNILVPVATCYVYNEPINLFGFSTYRSRCKICGKEFEFKAKGIHTSIEYIIDDIVMCVCYCDDCCEKYHKNKCEIWTKTRNMKKWHVSYPSEYCTGAEEETTEAWEYLMLGHYRYHDYSSKEFFDKLYNHDFRKDHIEYYVGKDFIEQQELSIEPPKRAMKAIWAKRMLYDIKKEKVLNDPRLFSCGIIRPVNFCFESSLTDIKALKMIMDSLSPLNQDDREMLFREFIERYSLAYHNRYPNRLELKDFIDMNDSMVLRTDIAAHKILGLNKKYNHAELAIKIYLAVKSHFIDLCNEGQYVYSDLDKSIDTIISKLLMESSWCYNIWHNSYGEVMLNRGIDSIIDELSILLCEADKDTFSGKIYRAIDIVKQSKKKTFSYKRYTDILGKVFDCKKG